MGNHLKRAGNRLRLLVQIGFTALTNGYLAGFFRGKIYTGKTKSLCVPGLNCYSCPGALGSCPIGSLQAVLADRNYKFAFYVSGFLLLFGAVLGRFVCGWLCPFGLVQDLLHKIPFPKKLRKIPGKPLATADDRVAVCMEKSDSGGSAGSVHADLSSVLQVSLPTRCDLRAF